MLNIIKIETTNNMDIDHILMLKDPSNKPDLHNKQLIKKKKKLKRQNNSLYKEFC